LDVHRAQKEGVYTHELKDKTTDLELLNRIELDEQDLELLKLHRIR
jgi:hypothetical protein